MNNNYYKYYYTHKISLMRMVSLYNNKTGGPVTVIDTIKKCITKYLI